MKDIRFFFQIPALVVTLCACGNTAQPAPLVVQQLKEKGVVPVTDTTIEEDTVEREDDIQVANAPPSTPFVTIYPQKITQPTDLYAVIVTASTDPDGDAVTYSYEWFLNGYATGITGTSVPASLVRVGDLWQVVVFASDGTDASQPAKIGRTVAFTDGRIALGWSHVCAVTGDLPQKLKCWGDDAAGQFGEEFTGTTTTNPLGVSISTNPVLTPREIELAAPPVTVAAGGGHTCLIDTNAEVWCFGNNAGGQLGYGPNNAAVPGNGGMENMNNLYLPPMPPTRPYLWEGYGRALEADQVVTGQAHTCILTRTLSTSITPLPPSERVVWCWGWNYHGQLGFGYTSDPDVFFSKPTEIPNVPRSAKHISSQAWNRTCAVSDTDVHCWGQGFGPSAVTIPAWSAKGIEKVWVASSEMYAADSTGTIYLNTSGGYFKTHIGQVPTLVTGERSSGEGCGSCILTTYALFPSRAVLTWTSRIEAVTDTTVTIVPVDGPTTFTEGVSEFRGDGVTACYAVDDRLACWGRNWSGDLGRGLVSDYEETPAFVIGF